MLIRIGYDIELALHSPTTLLGALTVHPARAHDLLAPEALTVEPPLPISSYRDVFDNRIVRIDVPDGVAAIRLRNHAVIADDGLPDVLAPQARQQPVHDLPTEVLQFLLPSRYCEVDSALMQLAWDQFGRVTPGWARVQAICDYAHQRLRFDYQQARATRTAHQGWEEGVGVCRDFTHLAITLCRCMNIPARYATGYLGDIGVPVVPYPMDFSAWFEVWLDGRWYSFDARHNTPRIGRVAMAYGRDAADVPITMVFGGNRLNRFQVVTDEVTAEMLKHFDSKPASMLAD